MNTTEPDYYEILGVDSGAAPADITAAYYALARRFHPDTSEPRQDPGRFKLIAQAYEILSDEQLRREYDRRRKPRGSSITVRSPTVTGVGRPAAPLRPVQVRARDIVADLPVSPEEARHGGLCELRLTVPQRCPACAGTGTDGDGRCNDCEGRGSAGRSRLLTVKLPAGIRSGTVLRVVGVREDGDGDLVLTVRVRPSWRC